MRASEATRQAERRRQMRLAAKSLEKAHAQALLTPLAKQAIKDRNKDLRLYGTGLVKIKEDGSIEHVPATNARLSNKDEQKAGRERAGEES